MNRTITALVVIVAFFLGQTNVLWAQQRSRGSVSATSRGSVSRSGNTASWESRSGKAQGSKTVSQTGEGYNVNKTLTTDGGASKTVSKDVNVEDREVQTNSTTTNKWGQSATRERNVEGQGGYATIEGSAKTSTGREASADLVAGRTVYGQPAVAGSVNTKYNGNYNVAAARNPYGGYTKAVAGPYGGKVTTTLPSGYRTTSYFGRPYYSYGGAYYRPYTHRGVHYYYPVPVPYYAYYPAPPVGAIIIMVAGVSYMMAKDGSYSKQTTSSEGKVVYQSVPPPAGASVKTLPAERVLVTVSGTTYYLSANAFYRRVVTNGAGDVRERHAAGGRGLRRRAARGLRGRPAQHDVLPGERAVLRALSVGRRQGNVRDGGPPAAAAAAGWSPSLFAGRSACGCQGLWPVRRGGICAGSSRREGVVHGRRRDPARHPARR